MKDHCHFTGKHRSAMHSIYRYSVPREIPIVLHNGSNYEFHLTIKQVAEKFDSNDFGCLGDYTKKCITFPVSMNKIIKKVNMKTEDY